MLKLSDLVQRPDFRLGPLEVSPARRRVAGPAGEATVEPLVMQLLLLLIDGRGQVVTRIELFNQLWGGVMVGDDSLNRAVAGARRAFTAAAPGLIEVETVPRTGYRLTGDIVEDSSKADDRLSAATSRRRLLIGGGAATAVAAVGAGLWSNHRRDQQFDALLADGEQVLDYGDVSDDAERYFRRAVTLRPNSAEALGLLAFSEARNADYEQGAAVGDAERAARAALAIDPRQPDARLALTVLQRSTLDLAANEKLIRGILADDPKNIWAMRLLWNLMQCVGRSEEALALVDHAITVKPLAAGNNYPRAQLLWILGRTAEADRVIDRAMQYWPEHRFVRFARFIILAFTDRPRAALAMLDGNGTAPQGFTPESIRLWRVSLAALDHRTPATIAAARTANLAAARANLGLASQAIMVLAVLGDVDGAFQVASELFVVADERNPSNAVRGASTAWRFAPWLFVPPTATLRADHRFQQLCDGIGLTDYWLKRRVRPDFPIAGA